jgi:hypothetical protein
VQQDYILRMIEQLGQTLIALRRVILGQSALPGDVEDRLMEVSRTAGLDLALARAATPETLQMMVAPTGEVDPSRCWLIGEMLFLDALQAEAEERTDDARAGFEKALRLFGIIEPGGVFLTGWPEAEERIAEIRGRLLQLD